MGKLNWRMKIFKLKLREQVAKCSGCRLEETGNLNKAFEVAKQVFQRDSTSELIKEKAYHLANQLDRVKELREAIEDIPSIEDIPF